VESTVKLVFAVCVEDNELVIDTDIMLIYISRNNPILITLKTKTKTRKNKC